MKRFFTKKELQNTSFFVQPNEQPSGFLAGEPVYDRTRETAEGKIFSHVKNVPHGIILVQYASFFSIEKNEAADAYLIQNQIVHSLYDLREYPGYSFVQIIDRFQNGLFTKEMIHTFGLTAVQPGETPAAVLCHERLKEVFYRRDLIEKPIFVAFEKKPSYYAIDYEISSNFSSFQDEFQEPDAFFIHENPNIYPYFLSSHRLYDMRKMKRFRLKYLSDDRYDPRKDVNF